VQWRHEHRERIISHARQRDLARIGHGRDHLPTWCGVSADENASRLWDNEGRCVHQTVVTVVDPAGKQVADEAPRFCPPIELVLLVTTDPAGREVESADVLLSGQESNLEQLARLANAIVDLGEVEEGEVLLPRVAPGLPEGQVIDLNRYKSKRVSAGQPRSEEGAPGRIRTYAPASGARENGPGQSPNIDVSAGQGDLP
jgi:hypothetical protein